jgi:hypothetical protein
MKNRKVPTFRYGKLKSIRCIGERKIRITVPIQFTDTRFAISNTYDT